MQKGAVHSDAPVNRIRHDLEAILRGEAFPIRGWEMAVSRSPMFGESKYNLLTEKAFERGATGLLTPYIEQNLLTDYIAIQAKFQIVRPLTIFGKDIIFTPEQVENQYVNIVLDQDLIISLDASLVPTFEDSCLMVDFNALQETTERWVSEMSRDQKKAQTMLAQLKGVQENSLHALHQALGRLGGKVKQGTPDYWSEIEACMAHRITPDQLVKRCKGAVLAASAPVS
jgi:hypothetical protein